MNLPVPAVKYTNDGSKREMDLSEFDVSAAIKLVTEISDKLAVCPDGPWMIPDQAIMPDGTETGKVYVLGVGGSTLRLSKIFIPEMHMETVFIRPIPIEAKKNVFEWAVSQFAELLPATETVDHIHMSWSFPLVRGTIASMGKDFCSDGYIGKSLAAVMNEKFQAAGLTSLSVESTTHDGAASLACGRYASSECHMALTLGTGININVVDDNDTMINTEISMLGGDACAVKLPTWHGFDNTADLFQPLERRVGGIMLGEIAAKLAAELAGKTAGTAWDTRVVWRVLEEDEQNSDSHKWHAANAVATRAAFLVACVLYAVAQAFLSGRSRIVVACTGGVILEPQFKRRIIPYLQSLKESTGVEMVLVPEQHGSEVGAAIMGLAQQRHSTAHRHRP